MYLIAIVTLKLHQVYRQRTVSSDIYLMPCEVFRTDPFSQDT